MTAKDKKNIKKTKANNIFTNKVLIVYYLYLKKCLKINLTILV